MAAFLHQWWPDSMPKVSSIQKAREKKREKAGGGKQHDGFQPCSPDMTICGDCEDNREKNKCPRLKEWRAKRNIRHGDTETRGHGDL